MSTVIKNEGKMTEAWELGAGSAKEQEMIEKGLIVAHEDGEGGRHYELLSQEAVNAAGEGEVAHGEIAHEGDFFKVDGSGFPYPNEQEWFLENHTHIEGDTYEQHPKPLEAYNLDKDGENMPEAIRFLVDNGLLVINKDDPEHYYSAELWGTKESADPNATVVIYGVTRDEKGEITGVDFNLVAKGEFDATYHYVELPNQDIESGAEDKAEIREGFEHGLTLEQAGVDIEALLDEAEKWVENNMPETPETDNVESGTEAGNEDAMKDVAASEEDQQNDAAADEDNDDVDPVDAD